MRPTDVVCPRCGSGPREPCMSRNNKPLGEPHKGRWIEAEDQAVFDSVMPYSPPEITYADG